MSPNVALISAVSAIVAVVLSIFGASWLNQRATERLIDLLEKQLQASLGAIYQRFDAVDQNIKQRFEAVDQKFEAVYQRFDYVDQRLDRVDQRIDRIDRQLEGIFKPSLPPRT